MPRPTSIRFGEGRMKRLKAAALRVELGFADTVRQAIDLGLPLLKTKLGRKNVRRTSNSVE